MVVITRQRRFRRDLTWTAILPGRPGISSAEVSEWLAYEQIEGPLTGQRGDFHAAQIVQALIAIFATKKGKKPPKLDDLILDFDPGRPRPNALELLRKAAAANRAASGIDTSGPKLVSEGGDD